MYCPKLNSDILKCNNCGECKQFHCIITGDEKENNKEYIYNKLDVVLANVSDLVIVTGDNLGVDKIALEYAFENRMKFIEFPIEWEKYGKESLYLQTRKMYEYVSNFKKNGAIAFFGNEFDKEIKTHQELAYAYNVQSRIITNNNSLRAAM